MALTTINASLVVARWSLKVFREWTRDSIFAPYTGTKQNNVFQIVEDLKKKAGDNVTMPLVGSLADDAWVYGDDMLDGNEQAMDTYADTVTVNQRRTAVKRGKHEQSKTLINILREAKGKLKELGMVSDRNLKIARMLCTNADGVTAYASSNNTVRTTFQDANTDRFLFGILKSNLTQTVGAGGMDTSLTNLDTTNDLMDTTFLSLAKRMVKTADPGIRPITIKGAREIYVAFAGTDPMRDMRSALSTIHQNAAPRSVANNPLYQDGDLVYNDIICKEVPEMVSIGNVGNGNAPVYQVAVCGAQAVWQAIAKGFKGIRNGPEGQDYGNRHGVGIAITDAYKKTIFNSKQHGMLSGWVAAAADS